jgi:hypothetical protein
MAAMRFTIRDMLWLTAMIGVLLAWRLDRSKLSERVAFLEWKKTVYVSVSGTEFSAESLGLAWAKDEKQRTRFANQKPVNR